MSMHSNRTAHRTPTPTHRRLAPVAALLAAMLLTACGGGGGSPGNTFDNGGVSTPGGSGSTGSGGTGTSPGTGTGTTTPAPTAPASIQLVTAVPTDKSIVLQGQGGSGRTETATLTFKLLDTNGNPLANKLVNFSTTSTNVKLNTPSGITDATGLVTASVNSMAVPTSFRVQATVPNSAAAGGQDVTTVSDTIVVTTGLPVQRAFSLSVETFNVDGWDYDSSPDKPATHVNVLVADAFGNPVADGTPVVFQTNMGSIGSSSRGGCNTVNGGCSVDFRTQLPRVPQPNQPVTACNSAPGAAPDSTRVGVATICASTTDGKSTFLARTNITFSGSTPAYVFNWGSSTPNKPLPVSTNPIDLGTYPTKEASTINLELDDINFNAMPAGTTVKVSGTQGLSASGDSNVVNTPPDAASNDTHQGTLHAITVTSAAAGTTPCAPSTGKFTLEVAIPRGLKTLIPFTLSFSCP